MTLITADQLTTAELKAIQERYGSYHYSVEFWRGFADYEERRCYTCPYGRSKSVSGEAWHKGSEAAMRVRWERGIVARDEYERDDRETALQVATLEARIEERKKKTDKAAAWARVFEPGKYPHLHLAGGQRAGRVGEDRFRGRYHPHLVIDNSA